MPAAACQQPATPATARAYRPRRPAATLLHELVRNYLRCGILAHCFARVYCGNCRHDFLVPFSCKGRDLCPSCATRRVVEVSAHMVEQVLPRVQHRQWVLSMPKRVRWHLRHKPEVSLRRPTADGRTELLLTPVELLDLLAQLVTPPRLHKHRYCGVLAPNAALREAVTVSAGPAGATL